MIINRTLMSVAAVALLAASPALAESPTTGAAANTQIKTPVGSASVSTNASLNEIDTNGDGVISKDEHASAQEAGAEIQQFAQLDTNRDGKVSAAELKAGHKAHVKQ